MIVDMSLAGLALPFPQPRQPLWVTQDNYLSYLYICCVSHFRIEPSPRRPQGGGALVTSRFENAHAARTKAHVGACPRIHWVEPRQGNPPCRGTSLVVGRVSFTFSSAPIQSVLAFVINNISDPVTKILLCSWQIEDCDDDTCYYTLSDMVRSWT